MSDKDREIHNGAMKLPGVREESPSPDRPRMREVRYLGTPLSAGRNEMAAEYGSDHGQLAAQVMEVPALAIWITLVHLQVSQLPRRIRLVLRHAVLSYQVLVHKTQGRGRSLLGLSLS
jgi:hypothetical protein